MRLYNTQSQSLERFAPHDGPARIYVCGVTPYDTTHIGHAFAFLTFDILIRYLQFQGYETLYVQNVTDIDDDILRKAKELGIGWDELGRQETEKYLADMRNLNALDPDHFTAATEHITEVVNLVEKLVDAGVAYESNGNVYFSVDKDPEFGKLSRIDRADMLPIANERGNHPDDPNKQDPLDFVLWQAGAPGEPTWDSPWSKGRPGWHIECSAMSMAYLGPSLDIHGGGDDLLFPHHEAEIAQSETGTGVKPFVRTWMHVAMVEYQGEKMSKSLGNLVLVSDALETYDADTLRLYMFSHHYRSNWEYIDEEVDSWAQIASDLRGAATTTASVDGDELDVSRLQARFIDAMDDDLDTPTAISALRDIAAAILQASEEDDIRSAQRILRELAGVLGLTLGED